MLRIEKMSNGEVVDLIEGDGYTIKTYTKPSQNAIDMICKMSANDISNVNIDASYQRGKSDEIFSLCIPQVGRSLNCGSMVLMNTNNEVLKAIIPPIHPNSAGVIGAVELDWVSYSGSDTVRGTMNLNESSKIVNEYGKYKYHIVIDFPTHACNGSIDKIVLLDHGIYNTNIKSSHFNFKSQRFVPVLSDRDYIKGYHHGAWSIAYCKNNLGVEIYKSFSWTDANSNIVTVSTPNISKSFNIKSLFGYTGENFYIFQFRNEFYLNNRNTVGLSSSQSIYTNQWIRKIQLTITDTDIQMELGTQMPINSLFKDMFQTTDKPLIRVFEVDNGITLVGCDNTNITKVYDSNMNIVKTLNIPITRNYLRLTDGINIFYILGNKVLDKDFNIVGVENFVDESSTTMCSYRYLYINGVNYMINSRQAVILEIQNAQLTTYPDYDIFKLESSSKPILEIDLAEPLTKTNAETLKLIFDFDIKIQ